MADPTEIPKYKLIYFPIRGRGEFIRYLFALAEVPYEEEHIEFSNWPQRKTGNLINVNQSKKKWQSHQQNSCRDAFSYGTLAGYQ